MRRIGMCDQCCYFCFRFSPAEGIEVVLTCDICAYPFATVAWLKDNGPLASSERAYLEEDGGRHTLFIRKAECSDSGLYTIIASNVHGTTSCSAPLTVTSGKIQANKVTRERSSTGVSTEYSPDPVESSTDFLLPMLVKGLI